MTGMFAQVQIGQKAALKELEHGFELLILSADQPGPVVTEVASDYISMEDVAGGVITRVPKYLIKAVDAGLPLDAGVPADADVPVAPVAPEVIPHAA